MKRPPETEKVALWILSVLKAEHDREPSLLKSRPFREVIGPTMHKYRLVSADVNRGMKFLVDKRCVSAITRHADGLTVLPTTTGLEYLSRHEAGKKAGGWTLDRRLTLYGLLLAIITAIGALVAKYWL